MSQRGLRAVRRSGRIAQRRDCVITPSTPPQSLPPPAAFIPVVALAPSSPDCGSVIEVRLVGGARLVWPDGRALTELAQLLHLLAT